jgi:glucose 1-dehydrogenase
MSRLEGKIAIVTGGASGNGRGIALRFAEEGADVVVADVASAAADETARLVQERGRRALAQRCDVSLPEEIARLLAATVERFGRVDIAVANAGVVETGTDCLTMSEEQWDRTISVNLKGVFFTLQAAAKQMIAQGGGGRLIATASIMAEWGSPASPAYAASKGGVKQLVKSFALMGGQHGITCNGIAPGLIETGMTAPLMAVPQAVDYMVDRTPIGRVGQPADVAAVAAFLASDDAGFVTGTMITPDGGITAGMYSAMSSQLAAAMRAAGTSR